MRNLILIFTVLFIAGCVQNDPFSRSKDDGQSQNTDTSETILKRLQAMDSAGLHRFVFENWDNHRYAQLVSSLEKKYDAIYAKDLFTYCYEACVDKITLKCDSISHPIHKARCSITRWELMMGCCENCQLLQRPNWVYPQCGRLNK